MLILLICKFFFGGGRGGVDYSSEVIFLLKDITNKAIAIFCFSSQDQVVDISVNLR